ncbi:Oidioi.mRNA.OKI2018_I69.PAR.g10617.t1.cds [Oikopleura dioica]|uniref:Oidioi.mRNA.OKI2018_I69.PAR.g10617.t1.cds n=1 Tax=Oikopleura dioica TaxID=34765 RepID=A0ABN7RWR3_OIKDI|nr:Oidioi.mRNA.OKI2018_I69.PAR.g10617.t1.cds [Oikopleura dioica]
MNYILSLKEVFGNEEEETVHIDAGRLGNAARFANHSCSPNAKLYPVRVENDIARIALFALRFIEPGEEITYDYGSAESTLSDRKCHCGSRNCRLFMPSDD